jgi:hypothetical protein
MSAAERIQTGSQGCDPDDYENGRQQPKGSELYAIPNNRAASVRLDIANQLRPYPPCPSTILTVVISTESDPRSPNGPVDIRLMIMPANPYGVAQCGSDLIGLRRWTQIALKLGSQLVQSKR